MTEMELYKLWCEKAVDDPDLQTELKSIEADSEELSVQAHTDLMFTLSDVQHRVLQTM